METVVNASDKLYKYYIDEFEYTRMSYPAKVFLISEHFGISTSLVYKYIRVGKFLHNHPVSRVSIRANCFENDMNMLYKLANSGDGWLFRLQRILNPEIDKFDIGERGVQYNVVNFLSLKGFKVQEYVRIPHGMQADIIAEKEDLKIIVEVKKDSGAKSVREAVGQCKYYAHAIKSITGVEYLPYIAVPIYPIYDNTTLYEWVEREGVEVMATPLNWESHF